MIDVMVQVFAQGETKRAVVPVEEQCFDPEKVCWKAIANIRAAVVLELPFTLLERAAKHGLRPEDRARLREMYGGKAEGDGGPSGQARTAPGPRWGPAEGAEGLCTEAQAKPLAASAPTGDEEDGGRPMTAPTDGGTDCHGPQAALAMTDEREEETA